MVSFSPRTSRCPTLNRKHHREGHSLGPHAFHTESSPSGEKFRRLYGVSCRTERAVGCLNSHTLTIQIRGLPHIGFTLSHTEPCGPVGEGLSHKESQAAKGEELQAPSAANRIIMRECHNIFKTPLNPTKAPSTLTSVTFPCNGDRRHFRLGETCFESKVAATNVSAHLSGAQPHAQIWK